MSTDVKDEVAWRQVLAMRNPRIAELHRYLAAANMLLAKRAEDVAPCDGSLVELVLKIAQRAAQVPSVDLSDVVEKVDMLLFLSEPEDEQSHVERMLIVSAMHDLERLRHATNDLHARRAASLTSVR